MLCRCFLLTPKLLPDLEYSEACSILNIMNGPWIEQPSKGMMLLKPKLHFFFLTLITLLIICNIFHAKFSMEQWRLLGNCR